MTSDESLQEAIENDKDYGVKYTLSNEIADTAENPQAEYTAITEVTTWQQAKEFLHSQPYGVSLRSLTTPEKIGKAAQSRGLSFPNITE